MDKDIEFGILMRKVMITENMYIFIPVHVIKGLNIENCFIDTIGKDYAVLQPGTEHDDFLFLDEEYYVGYTMSQDELQKVYPNDDAENLEMYFYNKCKNYCLLSSYDGEKIKYAYINMKDLLDKYLSALSGINNDNNSNNDRKDEKVECSTEEYLGITDQEIDNLIRMAKNSEYKMLLDRLYDYKTHLTDFSEESLIETEETINEDEFSEPDELNTDNGINVNEFYINTKKKIIGQDEAIKEIISAVKMDSYANNASEKNRCFIIGPTGTGKTEIVKCLGEYLDKPVLKIDTTQLTTPGYVGGTLEGELEKLVSLADGDIEKAENGIVTFDEIDKKCGKTDQLFGQGFLYTLLPFLDGTDYTIKVNGITKRFNTSKLTVFASGSFSEIIKNHTLDKKSLGFNAAPVTKDSPYLSPDEIFKRARVPEEIMGRFPIVVTLNAHTKESLSKILRESDISQLKIEKRKFSCLGVDLNWEDKYIEAVASEAIKLNIGARSLKKIVEKTIKELRWEILTNPNKYKEVVLLEETVSNPKVYRLK